MNRTGVSLPAGTQRLGLVMDTAGIHGAVGNLNWMRFTLVSGGPTPFTGTAFALPGRVDAKNFDNGGAGIAYHDDSPGNSGGAYRATDVDLEATSDAGGGHNVGWASAGEWLSYTANVAATGRYTVQVRVASQGAGGTFHLEVGGVDVTGTLVVPDTGGWQSWTTVGRTGVLLGASIQQMRLVMDTAGGSGAVGNFNWIEVEPELSNSTRITSPVAGSQLLTTTVTFQWEGVGDEFWVTIGSAPGLIDVYASGSLGQATAHTVNRLPLNGRTLYFELHRRIGEAVDITHAHYIAPFRKGVAIITDFANRSLEDWTGPGIRTVDDLSVQLRSMEQHWAWLSRGLERMQWDIIRIQLDQPAVANAYRGMERIPGCGHHPGATANQDGGLRRQRRRSGRRRMADCVQRKRGPSLCHRWFEPQCRCERVRRWSSERQRPGWSDRELQSRIGTSLGTAGHVRHLWNDEFSDAHVVQLARSSTRLQRV